MSASSYDEEDQGDDGSDADTTSEGANEAADDSAVIDDAFVNRALSRRVRKREPRVRGPRSISTIIDPRLYEDQPDFYAVPPPDPELFPMLSEAVRREVSQLPNATGDEEALPITRERVHSMTRAAHLGHIRAGKAAAGETKGAAPTRLMVIFNPVSGSGQGARVARECVEPILRLAKLPHSVHPTQYAGHATEMVAAADISELAGIVVCGGDGMVSEILTGVLAHGRDAVDRIKIGIIPVGTANAIANVLDNGISKRPSDLIHRAALAIAAGETRRLDVIEVVQRPLVNPAPLDSPATGTTVLTPLDHERTHYGMVRGHGKRGPHSQSASYFSSCFPFFLLVPFFFLFSSISLVFPLPTTLTSLANLLPIVQSCVAWGLAGACTARAERLRWVPGQKKLRYDLAGFLTLCSVSPGSSGCRHAPR